MSDTPSRSDATKAVARAGYAAKGLVYLVIGGLAVQQAVGGGGDTSGARGALREIAQAPFGKVLLGLTTIGLAGYVAWRLIQATVDPEGDPSDDGAARRWAVRAFYFGSAVVYGLLAFSGVTLLMGSGGGSGDGSAGWAARLMRLQWGTWLVGAVGAGVIARGVIQFVKAYTTSFAEKIDAFDLAATTRTFVMNAARVGLSARGVVFGIVGSSIIHAAATRDPNGAQGTEGALEALVSRPWLLGAVGVGLIAYAGYQWVKARYRLIGA